MHYQEQGAGPGRAGAAHKRFFTTSMATRRLSPIMPSPHTIWLSTAT